MICTFTPNRFWINIVISERASYEWKFFLGALLCKRKIEEREERQQKPNRRLSKRKLSIKMKSIGRRNSEAEMQLRC